MQPPRRIARPAVLAAALLLVAASAAGCSLRASRSSGDGTGASPSASVSSAASGSSASTGTSPSTTASTTASTSAGTSPTTTASASAAARGCAATSAQVPAGAGTAATADLDGDGRPDALWISDSIAGDGATVRTLGVRTASGAVFSTRFDSAAPQAASAIGQRLGASGPAIVLLDTGRSVQLYAVVGCRLVASRNKQGQQYTFDLGFTGYGTGVGCEPVAGAGGDLGLYGLLAHQTGSTWTVTGTRITLTGGGARAVNGARRDVVTGADSGAASVQAARTVSCGDQTRGAGEPQH